MPSHYNFQMPGLTNPAPQNSGFGSQGLNFEPFKMPGASFAQQEGGFFGEGIGKIGDVLGSEQFGQGVSAFSTLANIYGGFKSLGLAKDQFRFNKKAFNLNFNAQAQDYENTLKDRWAARNASAEARGQSYTGMNEWLSGRTIARTGGQAGGNTGG